MLGVVRRLYLYTVCGISLSAFAAGAAALLIAAFRELARGSILVGGGISREQLSLAIALISVSGPVWALHWWLARRGLRADGPHGDEERASAVRAWYSALVQAVSLAFTLTALTGLLTTAFMRAVGLVGDESWYEALAVALIAAPVWAISARGRWAEIRATRMSGSAAWAIRLYRYGAAFAGLSMLAFGAAGLVSTLLSAIVGSSAFGVGDRWEREAAAAQLAAMVVGLAAWSLHWRDATQAVRDAALIGEDERRASLRAVYFGAVLLVMSGFAALSVADALADLARWVAAIKGDGAPALLEQVVGPLLSAVPLAVAGAWHARRASSEAARLGAAEVLDTRRAELLLVSLTGLAFLAAGGLRLVELALVRVGLGASPALVPESASLGQLAWYLAQLAVGAALWLPTWAGVLSLRARSPGLERAAPMARAHLFLLVGASIVAAVPSASIALYRLLDTLLGARPEDPLAVELAFPVATLLVAVSIGAYHGWLLVGDIRASAARAQPTAAPPSEVDVPSAADAFHGRPAAPPAGPAPVVLELVVRAPPGSDPAALVAELRRHIPPDATLEQRASDAEPVPDAPQPTSW